MRYRKWARCAVIVGALILVLGVVVGIMASPPAVHDGVEVTCYTVDGEPLPTAAVAVAPADGHGAAFVYVTRPHALVVVRGTVAEVMDAFGQPDARVSDGRWVVFQPSPNALAGLTGLGCEGLFSHGNQEEGLTASFNEYGVLELRLPYTPWGDPSEAPTGAVCGNPSRDVMIWFSGSSLLLQGNTPDCGPAKG